MLYVLHNRINIYVIVDVKTIIKIYTIIIADDKIAARCGFTKVR